MPLLLDTDGCLGLSMLVELDTLDVDVLDVSECELVLAHLHLPELV